MADMENLPYHRKYRPNTLSRYIGNEKLKRTVMSVLQGDKRPQVIMLYGDSGCGKTTMARLLAKEYMCENRDDENGACGVCPSCETMNDYIATGDTSMLSNVQEIDITDQSGKRDLDSVFEDMNIPTFGDEWKVYIFDEVHMSTPALQNRLLKIAEEPPEHVLMILCTTNPEKLIETLKNRCQLKLHVQKPKLNELAGLLKYVCDCEQVPYDKKGLEFIANRGELTIRTALTNLNQVVNETGEATYNNATDIFETVSDEMIIKLFRALKRKDVLKYVTLLAEIKAKTDLGVFLNELKNFVVRGIYTINGVVQEAVTDNELVMYRDLFGDLSVVQIETLLMKLLSVDTRNIEVELLTLGYTGFDEPKQEIVDVDELVKPLENELQKEQANVDSVRKEKQKEDYQKGIENSQKFTETATIDMLLAMGASIVEQQWGTYKDYFRIV